MLTSIEISQRDRATHLRLLKALKVGARLLTKTHKPVEIYFFPGELEYGTYHNCLQELQGDDREL